ncbi:IDEAL domain-containing protein [Metabacillus sp. cB07]|uniref:IDEAL domain-containing protein n=1 Tax=Metabacillus sp. cB07 TaxID=2806989 RepID=UPI0019392FD4|nr:IDEAL domain-containing protein [Metabacillus sp. cB07]
MKNRKTYTEIMKSRNTLKMEKKQETVLDIYIQMVLDEAVLARKLSLLQEKIDESLDRNDKPLFFKLAKEYAELRLII